MPLFVLCSAFLYENYIIKGVISVLTFLKIYSCNLKKLLEKIRRLEKLSDKNLKFFLNMLSIIFDASKMFLGI
ncbi:hypothetical protein HNQ69_000302 [Bartonella callosciuri]|uniref:Uncharacterized protein n=1 Tax=Bartonella callosciuri TaxID=686223 RepID=A0A840NS18_9HYPH|nr:hypothetical protein [Bartonella callosciuri]